MIIVKKKRKIEKHYFSNDMNNIKNFNPNLKKTKYQLKTLMLLLIALNISQ